MNEVGFNYEVYRSYQASARDYPHLVPFPGSDPKYLLTVPYEFATGGHDFRIDAGFLYDGASIPTMLGLTWVITYSKFNPIVMRAALEHDFFCIRRFPFVPYDMAARRFHEVLLQDGADPTKARLMYEAVVRCGPKWP